jgi:1-acyl-sn-glycerol-3-phosphate acyltransferase
MATLPFFFLGKFDRYRAIRYLSHIVQITAKVGLWIFGVKPNIKNIEKLKQFERGTLIVSNHLSYTDIFILAAYFPSCFVTSIEMKKTPLLGNICDAAGCLYVERRSRNNLSSEILDITMALKSGINVVIFPEATSTNGDEVKRFKRPLFKSAIDAGRNILPLTINYDSLDDHDVNLENRDNVFWYGDMGFGGHFWSLLKLKEINVTVTLGDIIVPEREDCESSLANKSHGVVSNLYEPLTV